MTKSNMVKLNDIMSANLKETTKNNRELEILEKVVLNDEVVELIIRRYSRVLNRKREPVNNYGKYKNNILKSFKNKYETNEEFNKMIKKNALDHYYKDVENERAKRRAYYHNNREKLNNKNKERNKRNREKKNEIIFVDANTNEIVDCVNTNLNLTMNIIE